MVLRLKKKMNVTKEKKEECNKSLETCCFFIFWLHSLASGNLKKNKKHEKVSHGSLTVIVKSTIQKFRMSSIFLVFSCILKLERLFCLKEHSTIRAKVYKYKSSKYYKTNFEFKNLRSYFNDQKSTFFKS